MTLTWANARVHKRSIMNVRPRSRRRCWCGCKMRATHVGLANGIAMTTGCELLIRRWVRNPDDAVNVARRKAPDR